MGRSKEESQNPVRIDELLREFGFNQDAPETTARALVLNLIRSAYGPDAARNAFLQMNSKTTRSVSSQGKEVQAGSDQQLSFFDLKKSTSA